MSEVETEFLFEMQAELEAVPNFVGASPEGTRLIANVAGGTFQGPKIKGTIAPSGADWLLIRADGSMKIDVRAVMVAEDGTNIYATYGGRIVMPPDVAQLMGDREAISAIDPSRYYFRTAPMFEVAMESSHAWLNGIVAVGVGRLTSKGVTYRIHAVK